eukprot:6203169-Pleurochrysis_carterae.AAC.2
MQPTRSRYVADTQLARDLPVTLLCSLCYFLKSSIMYPTQPDLIATSGSKFQLKWSDTHREMRHGRHMHLSSSRKTVSSSLSAAASLTAISVVGRKRDHACTVHRASGASARPLSLRSIRSLKVFATCTRTSDGVLEARFAHEHICAPCPWLVLPSCPWL